MQCLALDMFHVRIVQIISDQRKTQVLHVDAYLMGTAGLQDEGDEAVSVFFFYSPVMCECILSVVIVHFTLDERTSGPSDGRIDGAGRRGDVPAHHGQIFSFNFMARCHAG